ncbi:MAG: hypothetical protein IPI58_01405 [Alphaproteobacteria bacterium]|nr:MAG: hypothetical protein IPI58_01405 [Alphaproteobacteria bacterium]
MTSVGFAPFDGEWWHFSYGDREWAKYYGRSHAIYSQIAFSSTPSPCRPDSSPTQSRLGTELLEIAPHLMESGSYRKTKLTTQRR